jgi:hypothetical protein
MRYLVFFILVILFGCQTKQCDEIYINGFTHFEKDNVIIYRTASENILKTIKPDEEAGWMVNVINMQGDYFQINIEDLNLNKVWIQKGEVYANTRNYDDSNIELKEKPNEFSTIVFYLHKQQTLKILNGCKDWAFVEGKDKRGNLVRGWVQSNMLCENPYTTCP